MKYILLVIPFLLAGCGQNQDDVFATRVAEGRYYKDPRTDLCFFDSQNTKNGGGGGTWAPTHVPCTEKVENLILGKYIKEGKKDSNSLEIR
jgi:hypothetical protein